MFRYLWMSVGYRGFPGSTNVSSIVTCHEFILYFMVMLFLLKTEIYLSSLNSVSIGYWVVMFTWTASLKKLSAIWGFIQSSQVLPVLLAICKDYRKMWNCTAGTDTDPVLLTSSAIIGSSYCRTYQDLLAEDALCWTLRLTAVQQTACHMTHWQDGERQRIRCNLLVLLHHVNT